ncbi:hypothetical protein BHE74_00025521, partial [Ensete ventricosum]
ETSGKADLCGRIRRGAARLKAKPTKPVTVRYRVVPPIGVISAPLPPVDRYVERPISTVANHYRQ